MHEDGLSRSGSESRLARIGNFIEKTGDLTIRSSLVIGLIWSFFITLSAAAPALSVASLGLITKVAGSAIQRIPERRMLQQPKK